MLRTAAWMLGALLVADLALGWYCRSQRHLPMGERDAVARYFEYGRSIEGKLREVLTPQDGRDHPLADVGWIRPAPADQPAAPGAGQDLLLAVYGMSFAGNIANQMVAQDTRLALRFSGGPGAPMSQCHALFEADRGRHSARVVVLAVLASSLPGIATLGHMTWNFEGPAACMYPRYELVGDELRPHAPPAGSLAELRAIAAEPARWAALRADLVAHDTFFDARVFDAYLDGSVLVRMARRAFGQSSKLRTVERLHGPQGFAPEVAVVAVALARRFAAQARDDGALPVLLLLEDRGHADHLHQVLRPLADDPGLLYFATHELVDPKDGRCFVPDGHFTPEVDARLAAELRTRIDARLGRR